MLTIVKYSIELSTLTPTIHLCRENQGRPPFRFAYYWINDLIACGGPKKAPFDKCNKGSKMVTIS